MATIFTMDAHAEGGPCRVMIAGVPPLRGSRVAERRVHLQSEHDWLRKALMHEPRGHGGMFGALLVPPEREESAFGLIFVDPGGYLDGCGHGTLCAVAVWHKLVGDTTAPFTVDNPDGSVTRVLSVEATCGGIAATLEMPIVEVLKTSVSVPGLPGDAVGLARCSNTYLLVRADALGIQDLESATPTEIRREAMNVRQAAAPSLEEVPGLPNGPVAKWLEVAIYQPATRRRLASPSAKVNVVSHDPEADRKDSLAISTAILYSGTQLDRSPCGTGSCSLFALLIERGDLAAEKGLITQGPVGGRFHLTHTAAEGVGRRFRLKGTAYLTGVHEWIIGEADHLGAGYRFE